MDSARNGSDASAGLAGGAALQSALGAALGALGATLGLGALGALAWALHKRSHPVIRFSQPAWLYVATLAQAVGATALLLCAAPADATCQAAAWLAGTSFCVAFATLGAKVWRVDRLLNSGLRSVMIGESRVASVVLCALALWSALLAAWQAADPVRAAPVEWAGLELRLCVLGGRLGAAPPVLVLVCNLTLLAACAAILSRAIGIHRLLNESLGAMRYMLALVALCNALALLGLLFPGLALPFALLDAVLYSLSGAAFLVALYAPRVALVRAARTSCADRERSGSGSGSASPASASPERLSHVEAGALWLRSSASLRAPASTRACVVAPPRHARAPLARLSHLSVDAVALASADASWGSGLLRASAASSSHAEVGLASASAGVSWGSGLSRASASSSHAEVELASAGVSWDSGLSRASASSSHAELGLTSAGVSWGSDLSGTDRSGPRQ
jgi:hypothetical protein